MEQRLDRPVLTGTVPLGTPERECKRTVDRGLAPLHSSEPLGL